MQYRDKQTGKFVKASTWKRSKAQGGTRFVRTPKYGTHKGGAYEKPLKTASRGEGGASPSPGAIKTAKDYIDMYDDFQDYEDQGEIETGVDY